jgi:hypothetical protein
VQTLLLDPEAWDLVLDVNGDIAVASNPYSLAQDAASQIKLFYGELWYQDNIGVPYWQQILGYLPPISVMKNAFVQAAELVPEVVTAQCFISSTTGRIVTGQVQILDDSGNVIAASFF